MATKTDTYEKFLADVLAEIPEANRAAFEETLKGSKKLREGVLAREDYSKNMDDLRSERAKFEERQAKELEKIKGWEDWYAKETQKSADQEALLKRYREEHGDLDDADGDKGKRKFVTEDAYRDELSKTQASSLEFMDALTDLKVEHRQTYGERLNTRELVKLAQDRHLPLEAAYDVFVADRRKERETKALDERIKKERDEAVREFQAQHQFPVLPHSNNPHPIDLAKEQTVGRTESERVKNAVGDFMKTWQGDTVL